MDAGSIINKVKTKLDELTPFNEGLVVTDISYTDLTYQYIANVLDESVYDLLMISPVGILPLTDLIIIPGFTNIDNVLHEFLPDDCIRVASVKLPVWNREVTKFITPESVNYSLQSNKWTRGSVSRPQVVLAGTSLVDKYIDCYSSDGYTPALNDKIGKYVKILSADLIPANLIDPLTWLMASKVLLIFEKEKLSEFANKEFQKSLMLR